MDGLDVDGAAISVLTTCPSRETLWATDPTAELLEDLQFSLNEGACVQAAGSRRPVLVANLRDSREAERWPIFAAAVAEHTEVSALFAFPLVWGAVDIGVMDLYRITPGELSPEQCRDALIAAETAALVMLGMGTEPERARDGDWLDPSINSRAEVHQATGMVLVQLGVSATEALARLRGYAFAEQRLLIDVARDVVGRRLSFTDDVAPDGDVTEAGGPGHEPG